MMKVFLAGATGVVGVPAARALVAAGHEVTAVARSADKAAGVTAAGAAPIAVNLFDPAAVREAVAGSDAVVNLATKIPPMARAWRRSAWADNDRIRCEVSGNLADGALAGGAEVFVQEALAFNYADGGDRWLDETEPMVEGAVTEALWAAEAAANTVTEKGARGVVLRFAQFYGPTSGHTRDQIRAARRGVFGLFGSPDAYWTHVHAEDAGGAVPHALSLAPGAYHVAEDDPITRGELAQVMAAAVGRRGLRRLPSAVLKVAGAGAEMLTRSQRASNAKLTEASDWRPRHASIRDAWAEVVEEIAR